MDSQSFMRIYLKRVRCSFLVETKNRYRVNMSDRILVTIITVAYNSEATIKRTIELLQKAEKSVIGTFMLIRLLQCSKTSLSILVTLSGIVTEVRPLHSQKAVLPMLVTE